MRQNAGALALLAIATLAGGSAAEPPTDYVLAVTSDFSVSGQVSTVGVLPSWPVDLNLASVHSDADARSHDGLVYVLNHLYGDNVQVLDPAAGFATVRQFSVGPGTNPVDIAFVSAEQAYVSRHNSAWLLQVDTTTGAFTDSIDLSPFADGDGLPEMAGLALSGGYLLVAIQRLDRDYYWNPVPPSYLVIIDTKTNQIVDPDPHVPGLPAITLAATNPYREMHLDGDMLYVAESGAWGELDGGIEVIDTGHMAGGYFVTTEAQLGGDIYDFTLPEGDRAHAVISYSSGGWEQFCLSFDWATGEKIADVWRPGGYDVMDIERHPGTGQLFLADRTYTAPGVRVFDATDDTQLTASPLGVGLPPYDLLVMGDDVTGHADGTLSQPIRLTAAPNPFRAGGSVELTPSLGPGVRLTACVYDVSGRVVARLEGADGRATLSWDGADSHGRPVASGVYFVRAAFESGAAASVAVVLLK
jgi:hypothetical protein